VEQQYGWTSISHSYTSRLGTAENPTWDRFLGHAHKESEWQIKMAMRDLECDH